MQRFFQIALAGAAACSLISGTATASEADAQVFTATGDWVIDFGDDYCRLSRNFSDGSNTLSLAFERTQPGYPSRLILVGDGLRPYRGADSLGYRFAPEQTTGATQLFEARTPEGARYYDLGPASLVPGGLQPPAFMSAADAGLSETMAAPTYDAAEELRHASGIEALVLAEGLYRPIELQTGNLREPIAALQACTDDLIAHWGIDARRHANASRLARPVGDVSEWFPRIPLRREHYMAMSGNNLGVLVMVDAAGSPVSCEVQSLALGETVNGTLCDALMENGRFQPALDAEGEPMASYWMVDSPYLLAVANSRSASLRNGIVQNLFSRGFGPSAGQNSQGQGQPSSALPVNQRN